MRLSFTNLPAEVRNSVYSYLFPPKSKFFVHQTSQSIYYKQQVQNASHLSNHSFSPPQHGVECQSTHRQPSNVSVEDASQVYRSLAIARVCRRVRQEVLSVLRANVDIELRVFDPTSFNAHGGMFEYITTLHIDLRRLLNASRTAAELARCFPWLQRIVLMDQTRSIEEILGVAERFIDRPMLTELASDPQILANTMAKTFLEEAILGDYRPMQNPLGDEELVRWRSTLLKDVANAVGQSTTQAGLPEIVYELRFDHLRGFVESCLYLWRHAIVVRFDLSKCQVYSASPLYVALRRSHADSKMQYQPGEEAELQCHLEDIRETRHGRVSIDIKQVDWLPWRYHIGRHGRYTGRRPFRYPQELDAIGPACNRVPGPDLTLTC